MGRKITKDSKADRSHRKTGAQRDGDPESAWALAWRLIRNPDFWLWFAGGVIVIYLFTLKVLGRDLANLIPNSPLPASASTQVANAPTPASSAAANASNGSVAIVGNGNNVTNGRALEPMRSAPTKEDK